MPKNHILNPHFGIIEMFESENRESSNQNRKIEIGINEATQLTRRIVTALMSRQATVIRHDRNYQTTSMYHV